MLPTLEGSGIALTDDVEGGAIDPTLVNRGELTKDMPADGRLTKGKVEARIAVCTGTLDELTANVGGESAPLVEGSPNDEDGRTIVGV